MIGALLAAAYPVMPMLRRFAPLVLALCARSFAEVPLDASDFRAAVSEGRYPRHLQGIATNGKDRIYWSWTTRISVTDTFGKVLKETEADDHQGDLCWSEGRLYVAVNRGRFNHADGLADNWIYVFDAESLKELARHPIPEVKYGAGGIAHHGGRFFVVGGLPVGFEENYLYEYDPAFRFQKRHVLNSGYTRLGIQTVAYAGGSWWFGCYGKPAVVLQADEQFKLTHKWEFDASLGIAPLPGGRFLIGSNTSDAQKRYTGRVQAFTFHPDGPAPFQPAPH
jgi:hypothetical protein